jgi:site-specific DNA recombinase
VQDVLDGNKRSKRPNTKIESDLNFPLRGFLACPICGRSLTGSASKGKYTYYSYYHCRDGCNFRHRSDDANRLFELELKKYVPHKAIVDLSLVIIEELYARSIDSKQTTGKKIRLELDRLNSKVSKARELLLADSIDVNDYKEIKMESEKQVGVLEERLKECVDTPTGTNLKAITERAHKALINLNLMYEKGTVCEKRKIISSIFTEKITFDGKNIELLELTRLHAISITSTTTYR